MSDLQQLVFDVRDCTVWSQVGISAPGSADGTHMKCPIDQPHVSFHGDGTACDGRVEGNRSPVVIVGMCRYLGPSAQTPYGAYHRT